MSSSPSAAAHPVAVLWDMDGTLVDTEPYWMAAETALVAAFDASWTHEQALTLVGQGLETSATILQEAGVRMSTRDIVDHLTAEVMRSLEQRGAPVRPGALEMLRSLREAGVRCALVTMSLRAMAEQVAVALAAALGAEDVGDVFEVIVSGDDATRPKPYPDAYLQALAALGLEAADAVAIEDSPTGVRAAVAAGVATIGVPLMVSIVGAGAHDTWPTLEGRDADDIAAFHGRHRTLFTGTKGRA